jgi:hypothetical protein
MRVHDLLASEYNGCSSPVSAAPHISSPVNRRRRYHQPSDDLSQPIHWPSAAALARLAADVARSIADDVTAPWWNPGDFFGTRFGTDTDKPARRP